MEIEKKNKGNNKKKSKLKWIKANKINSKILFDHLIFHNCASFKVQIVDRIFKADCNKETLENY